MILVDTSVWIDHLRRGDAALAVLLEDGQALAHPFVIGELALGHLEHRREVLGLLGNLEQATTATDVEVRAMIQNQEMVAFGIGYVDAHLLAATALTAGALLWSRDKRLVAAAVQHGLSREDPQAR